MSVSNYIYTITADRNTIRNKLIELGLAQTGDKLTKLATAIDNIESHEPINASVKEGDSFTILPGYHKGGTVVGTAGGGNYSLQPTVAWTPTKNQKTIAPTGDYYGLSGVIVEAIPSQYQDVSSVDVKPEEVLANRVFVDLEGVPKTGTMQNFGAVNMTLDTTTPSKKIDNGYHNGNGIVSITLEEKTAIEPKKTTVTVTPTSGKVLSKVTVNPIPSEYITTGDATATAAHILSGDTAYVDGEKVTGTMVNNGATGGSIDGMNTSSVTIPAGYTTGGTVSLTNDIENALAAI